MGRQRNAKLSSIFAQFVLVAGLNSTVKGPLEFKVFFDQRMIKAEDEALNQTLPKSPSLWRISERLN